MLFNKHYGFRLTGLQEFGPLALLMLMPAAYHMVRAAGIEAAVGTADHIYKPGVHLNAIICWKQMRLKYLPK